MLQALKYFLEVTKLTLPLRACICFWGILSSICFRSRGPGEFWSAYEQQLRETMMFGEGEGEENVKSFALTTSLLHLRTWASPMLALWCSFQVIDCWYFVASLELF